MENNKITIELNKSELEILSKSLKSYNGLADILTISPFAIKKEDKLKLDIKKQVAELLKTRINHELDKINNYEEK